MQTMIGFIGGSGFENFLDTKSIEIINVTNEWGKPSQAIKKISLGDKEFLFLQRHGDGENSSSQNKLSSKYQSTLRSRCKENFSKRSCRRDNHKNW